MENITERVLLEHDPGQMEKQEATENRQPGLSRGKPALVASSDGTTGFVGEGRAAMLSTSVVDLAPSPTMSQWWNDVVQDGGGHKLRGAESGGLQGLWLTGCSPPGGGHPVGPVLTLTEGTESQNR